MVKIPVYRAGVPEYKLKKFTFNSKKMTYAGTPWFNIKIPKVYWDNRPDFKKIGGKIDKCLKSNFLVKKVAVRVLGSEEHKGKSADELIEIIKKLGYDRYDSKIKGDRYENIDGKHIDFFALDFTVKKNGEYFRHFLEPFYFWPIAERNKPIRADIAIVYDLSKIKRVIYKYKNRETETKKDGFVFKYPDRKTGAILGIIKIL
ncbi:MAG TPA: hypothetical protein VJJ52_07935 [Candidatus Nanoarchaeia archaeon]|nr:hypothetical protein [Candidatus Nanoarchaeia archaeon]